jgi:hypothetical protein
VAPSSNTQREKDFMDSLKKIPQFEAMMTVLRLGQRAQVTFHECQYPHRHANVWKIQSQLPKDLYDQYLQFAAKAGGCLYGEKGGFPYPWCQEAEEIQTQVSRVFSDYPEAVSKFRQLVLYGHEAQQQMQSS